MNDTEISNQAIKLNLTSKDIEFYIEESADNGINIKTLNIHKEKTIQQLREFILKDGYKKRKKIEVKQLYKLI